jgi:hypothetical protein
MSTFVSRVLSRTYQFFTGVNVNATLAKYQDMQGSIQALAAMARTQNSPLPVEDWTVVFRGVEETKDCRELGDVLNKEKSDKAGKHNYHVMYAALLANKRQQQLSIWEIGLGTNDPNHASSMGVHGKPGASLRAFAQWAPKAELYGADNDRSTLFTEERIQTFYLDQTMPETFTDAFVSLPKDLFFDLIIDDGLHTSWANLNSITFALSKLKEGGVLVVEDILPEYLPWFEVAYAILSPNYSYQLVQMKSEIVCIISKK